MGAGRQHQRPGDAEVGEQHLAKFPEDGFPFPVQHRQLYVFQSQPLHLPAGLVLTDQRDQ